MQKMYPAVVNSPKTELVTDITATDTEIEVSDVSVLLAPEGLAVIGNGEGAETIRYAEVDGNVLKECIRGFQGVAKQWAAGTRLARNFTAYDHDTFMANIEQHDGAITALENRLDSADTVDLTLQPGLQVVSAPKDARFKLGQIEGKTEINYDGRIGLIGVENPYVSRISGNLLPPFYEWRVSTGATSTDAVIEPYLLQKTVPSAAQPTEIVVPVLGGKQLTLRYESSNSVAAYINIQWLDEDGTSISWTDQNEGGQTVLAPDNARFARVTATTLSAGTFTFKNPMLVIGNEPKTFLSREDSMLAFQTELHANPVDGSDPDVLFEHEGQYFKLSKWKKVVLDGSINWGSIPTSYPGFKVVATIPNQFPLWQNYSEKTTKYNGSILKTATSGGAWATNGADTTETSIDGSIYISISNTDSGWGDEYTPTPDEIKAYFLGWKMYDRGTNPTGDGVYNSGPNKGWAYRNADGNFSGGTTTLPTTQAPNFTPYQLVYRLATPTVEPVVSEGSLTLIEGENQVEVGTGVVLRERANPYANSIIRMVGLNAPASPNYPGSGLVNKVRKILTIFKDSRRDNGWSIKTGNSSTGGGLEYADISLSQYDPSAAYSVTYLKLDKSPIQSITGARATNEKAQISDLTAGVAEALGRVSVVEQTKTEKGTPVVLITPTLLNGWRQYPHYQTVGYRKDSTGVVHLTGLVQGGATVSNIFRLLEGFRPKSPLIFPVCASSGTNRVDLLTDGYVYFNWAGTWDSEAWISLDGISFVAEQ